MDRSALRVALRVGLPLLALGAAVALGNIFGLSVALLLLAFFALLLVITLLHQSLMALQSEDELSLDEALTLAAPTAEEEQKRAVLRALKDLEYERGVGKISEEDYAELSARYREEAKRLIQVVDAELSKERARVDDLLKKRHARRASRSSGKVPKTSAEDGREEQPPAKAQAKLAAKTESDAGIPIKRSCPECQRPNDLDALFCKACGEAMKSDGQVLCTRCPAVFEDSEAACPDCGALRQDASTAEAASVGEL